MTSNSAVKFVPQNAYGQLNGETVFTHGVELGVARADIARPGGVHRRAAERAGAGQPQPAPGDRSRDRRGCRSATAIEHQLVNRTPNGAQERVGLTTTFLADGNLFYLLTIVPVEESGRYQPAFSRVASTCG